mgnify:CR=1 FL=1
MTTSLSNMKLLITGGAGFIGSALVRHLLTETDCPVLNVDKMTYAAVPGALDTIEAHPRYHFAEQDICDLTVMRTLLAEFRPDAVINLAAESHVDRSIDGAGEFIQANIVGTYALLQGTLEYWQALAPTARKNFRFFQISTDEVFGPAPAGAQFNEDAPSRPSSPYAASKASADHLVMAWHHTFGLPVLISRCTNNFGPFQFPEKLIPLTIARAAGGQSINIYGDGRQQRDWLHVDDHVAGLLAVLGAGRAGQSYALGSGEVRDNLAVVTTLCGLLDEALPTSAHRPHENLITFVADRPGHDIRYALDITKARTELNWQPSISFSHGLRDTVAWYLQHRDWWGGILQTVYDGERLGQAAVQAKQ